MKALGLSMLLLLALAGCAGRSGGIHPALYGREDIGYIESNDCRSLERRYAAALAWEEGHRSRNAFWGSVYIAVDPVRAIAHSLAQDDMLEPDNGEYLAMIKKRFIKQGCEAVGYVAFDRKRMDKDTRKALAVSMCMPDEETGLLMCIKDRS